MKRGLAKAFIIFEVIYSLLLTNIVFILISILSLMTLFPVLLVSELNYMRRFYIFKEYKGILFTFFTFTKGRVIKSFQVLFPIIIMIAFLLLNMFYYNEILEFYFNPYIISVILLIQLLMLYQLFGILLISALQLTVSFDKKKRDIYKISFLMLNSHFIRGFLSVLSSIAFMILLLETSQLIILIFLPTSLFGFYIVFSDIFESEVKKYTIK